MGSFSDYLEDELLDHVLKVGAFSQPTNLYIALSTADPKDDASGLTEPSGGAYARELCNAWDTAASRHTQNSALIEFAEATAGWGQITHFAIMDALTSGNMIGHGALSEAVSVGSGDQVSFAAGALDILFSSGKISDYLANKLLDHVFKNSAYTPPTNIYIALATAAILDIDTGSTITEPSGGSYARKNHNSWDAASSGASENTGAITFVQATGAWGTITHTALTDALTGGNILFHGSLDSPQTINSGDQANFADGVLDISVD